MLVAKFGVRKFLTGESLAHAEMRAAAQYYQSLVTIERWRRSEFGAIRSEAVPGLGEVDDAYQALDEWIGEHAGKGGKRGGIREKRRKATAATADGTRDERGKLKVRPVKTSVDVAEEVDVIAEMKRWRKAAAELAKPLRAQFAAIVQPAQEEFTARSARLRAAWGSNEGDRHAKRRSDIQARDEMLSESQWPEAWRRLAQLETQADALRGWMKGARLLSVGTYHSIQRVDLPAASKRPKPRPDGEPRRPKQRPAYSRKRLRRIGWEINDATWGDLLAGTNNELRITDVRNQGGANGGRVKQRATVHMRLRAETRDALPGFPEYYRPKYDGADGNWWVTMDVVLHRPIPMDTKVRWAFLVPSEESPGRWEYSMQFTLDPTEPLIQRATGTGTVDVHLCWTQDNETRTLIVAHVNGEPLRLPGGAHEKGHRAGVVESLRFAEKLRGVADTVFDGARAELTKRLGALPGRVVDISHGLPQWRAHWKLRRVSAVMLDVLNKPEEEYAAWKRWRDLRRAAHEDLFEPDIGKYAAILGLTTPDTIFAFWLATWRRKDEHLEAMAAGARNHAMGRRRDFYRVTAAKLCTQFEQCEVSGAVDLDQIALRDKAEDKPNELHQAARHNRQLACVHELKAALKAAFGPDRYKERDQSGAEKKAAGAREAANDVETNANTDEGPTVSAAE